MGTVLKIFLIALGLGIAVRVLHALASRRIAAGYSTFWALLAVFLIVSGILVHPVYLGSLVSWPFFLLLLIFFLIVIIRLLKITELMSEFLQKNAELEMQVSLLNEENYRLRRQLEGEQAEGDEG